MLAIYKGIIVSHVMINVYSEGAINGIDDYFKREKKPFSTNIMNMMRSAIKGAVIGVTFPISTPLILYQQFK